VSDEPEFFEDRFSREGAAYGKTEYIRVDDLVLILEGPDWDCWRPWEATFELWSTEKTPGATPSRFGCQVLWTDDENPYDGGGDTQVEVLKRAVQYLMRCVKRAQHQSKG